MISVWSFLQNYIEAELEFPSIIAVIHRNDTERTEIWESRFDGQVFQESF